MDLFVVNRPEETNRVVDESGNITRLLKKIEKRKQQRIKRNETKNPIKNIIINRKKERIRKKREMQADLQSDTRSLNDPIDGPSNLVEATEQSEEQNVAPKVEGEGFTILGTDKYDKKPKIKRILPKWLSNPTLITVNLQDLQCKVSNMKCLNKTLRKTLKDNGVKHFFPVQAEVIPWLIKSHQQSNLIIPRDICVSAPTGSGKTLAFVLPVIQSLSCFVTKKIRALVILPTQDLAFQVYKTFDKYVRGTHLKVSLITGKSTFAQEQNELIMKNNVFGYYSKVDILVCTAGRLVHHLKETKGFDLSELKFLIIDEADRVLDNIQNDWLYHLEEHIHQHDFRILNLFTLDKPRPPQKLLFSATLSQDPEKIQKLSLFQPKLFTSVVEDFKADKISTDSFIGKYTTPKELTEKYIQCSADLKPLVLYQFIKQENLKRTLVFTHSVKSAHRLAILLQLFFKDQRKVVEVSSRFLTKQRNKLIEEFSRGIVDIIICTDKLARGIDLASVKCVISYTSPKFLKTYIHRAGRTARAGELGLAVTILNHSEVQGFQGLLNAAGKGNLEEILISEEVLEPLSEQYTEALEGLKKLVKKESQESVNKVKLTKKKVKTNARK
ncbi:probable ATP-dependent RNA helicase Dbp73D [Photinus pyralis]|uniref:ATP-dependent RNA helicase n=1 Tax=Photinus pyralis TaxID=7054 RepID=A0A1Y1M9I5_PHOPY|nr:probable ATP-dependent RNA helicase Dbp73D [Photinus pyralis]